MDERVLGIVSYRYKVVQNREASAFTNELLGEGVTYETAGSLQDGQRTWVLAKLPHHYIIAGDEISPYLVFMNSHDGTCAIKAAMIPIRFIRLDVAFHMRIRVCFSKDIEVYLNSCCL